MSSAAEPSTVPRTAKFEPRFRIIPKIQRQIKAIEHTAGFLEAVRLRPEWIAEVCAECQVREALASVQIEGSSLTLQEAFELAHELPDRELRSAEREFCNYLRAFEAVDSLRKARDTVLTKGDLLNLHRILVEGVRGGSRFAGQLRREHVEVGDIAAGETVIHHQPPPWPEVEPHVGALLAWIEEGKKHGEGDDDLWVHPVIQAGIAQHRLVWIHPFVDGNGRTSRMFTTLLLYQRGYDFKYLFELSTYYNADRDRYYETLRTVDRSGEYTNWLVYFLGGLALQMVEIEKRVANGRLDDDRP
jgi:Fic family protein